MPKTVRSRELGEISKNKWNAGREEIRADVVRCSHGEAIRIASFPNAEKIIAGLRLMARQL